MRLKLRPSSEKSPPASRTSVVALGSQLRPLRGAHLQRHLALLLHQIHHARRHPGRFVAPLRSRRGRWVGGGAGVCRCAVLPSATRRGEPRPHAALSLQHLCLRLRASRHKGAEPGGVRLEGPGVPGRGQRVAVLLAQRQGSFHRSRVQRLGRLLRLRSKISRHRLSDLPSQRDDIVAMSPLML